MTQVLPCLKPGNDNKMRIIIFDFSADIENNGVYH